ncbi:C-C chemokine receptor type 9 [Hoplias malabaricus]|uniref:C-C chemokine receptor type 9 n=1 Tax=Hoplias malabaricus TaxID=27720 RepID=UPI0034636FF4
MLPSITSTEMEMDNENFTAEFLTTDYMPSSSFVTEDYDLEDNGICDKTWVRNFRASYEPPLYWIIFVVGGLGNLLVVWIYMSVKNRLKTMTDVYLLNLAIADLLFLCTLPFWATDATQGWVFSDAVCKGVSAIYKVNFFASMLLLTCISVDRYIAIVRVTQAHNFKSRRMFYSKLACLVVWLLSCLLSLPEFLLFRVKNNSGSSCSMVYPASNNNLTKVLVLCLQISVGFCFPLLVMVACYSVIICTLMQARNFEKHKALRVIFAVVAAFILSQLPYNGHLVVEAAEAYNTTMVECEKVKAFDVAGQVVKSLAYTHCCLNPILYAFIGVRFRKDLLNLCHCLTGLVGVNKPQVVPKRPSIMSDTDTTPALSL